MTTDEQCVTCPVCGGEKKLMGIFPVYAAHVPQSERRPVIEMQCHFCNGAGTVDAAAIERREKGKRMRNERLQRKMTLRQEAQRLGISPSVLSRIEQGHDDQQISET